MSAEMRGAAKVVTSSAFPEKNGWRLAFPFNDRPTRNLNRFSVTRGTVAAARRELGHSAQEM
jgi:hypothetical protein